MAYNNRTINDIREDEITIEGKQWDDPKVQALAMKEIYVVGKMTDFWEPYLDRGEKLYREYDGDVFTDLQRDTYIEVEDKIPIEQPVAKSPLRALLTQILKDRKTGSISIEDADINNPVDTKELITVNIAMQNMEKKNYEHDQLRDAYHDALVACYPTCLLWQKRQPTWDNPASYGFSYLPWNSCVFGPLNFSGPGCTGFNEMAFFAWRSMSDLIRNFPNMEEQIKAHWGSGKIDDDMIASIMNWDVDGVTANDIGYLRSIIEQSRGQFMTAGGLIPVYQRLFPIERKEEVWVKVVDDEEGDEHVIIPSTWNDKRRNRWIEANKNNYDGPVERVVVTLWKTVFTTTGLVLSNEKHWFQEYGALPATFFAPAMQNGRPTGPMVDMSPEVLRVAVAQTEYLDDMRKGGGMVMIARDGAFTKPEDVPTEMNKAKGFLTVGKDFRGSIQDAYKVEKHEPSKAWKEYEAFAKNDMYDNTSLNETMQGNSAPRQAAIAKQVEIDMALAVNAIYIDNANLAWEHHQNMKLAMFPYYYDGTMIPVEGYDEKEKAEKKTTLNEPVYDENGDIDYILNDVTSRHYRWKVSPVDSSASAKQRAMQDALMVMNGAFGPLMQGDPSGGFLAKFLKAVDNPILNEMGKALEEDAKIRSEEQGKLEQQKVMQEAQSKMLKAQADLERAKKTGMNLTFTGEQLAEYPQLLGLYMNLLQNTGGPAMPGTPNTEQTQQLGVQ